MSDKELIEFLLIFDALYYCLAFGFSFGVGSGLLGLYRDYLDRKFQVIKH